MSQFGLLRIYDQGLPIMRALLDQRTAQSEGHLRVRTAEQERELALLAQFMRHDSVVSLAKALAEPNGIGTWDLIAAAGLDPSRMDS